METQLERNELLARVIDDIAQQALASGEMRGHAGLVRIRHNDGLRTSIAGIGLRRARLRQDTSLSSISVPRKYRQRTDKDST